MKTEEKYQASKCFAKPLNWTYIDAMQNIIFDRIRSDITTNDVVLYMKGSPVFPQCGFSAAASQILTVLGVEYHSVDVLQDPEIRQGIKDFAEWPTIPQLYVKGEFVGGCDIIREMYETSELQDLLREKQVPFSEAA